MSRSLLSTASLALVMGCGLTNNPTPAVRPEPAATTATPGPTPTAQPPAPATAEGTNAHAGCGGGSCAGNCGAHQAEPARQGVSQQLGAAITLSQTTPLSEVLANPSRFSGQTILTQGTVSAVCQAAGCWMRLVDSNNQQIHVRMHGHSFFIPRNATGRRATVQATVLGGVPNGHCEQEAAGQTGQQARLELDALGVRLES